MLRLELGQIGHGDVGARLEQGGLLTGPGDADDQTEVAGPPGGHPGQGVLDHRRAGRVDAEAAGRLEERVGSGLARKVQLGGDDAVDPLVEQVDGARAAGAPPRRCGWR